MSDESSTPPCDDSEAADDDPTVQIFISWSGMLEPVDVSLNATPEELACFIGSGRDVAPPEHMQFIYKGLLLPEQIPLINSAVGNGSVLHLVLNEEPYWGRPVYVRYSRLHMNLVVEARCIHISIIYISISGARMGSPGPYCAGRTFTSKTSRRN
jgi:hypothetical protein